MRPSAEKPRSRRRRHTSSPTEASKEHHETEVVAIETGLKLLDAYTSALKELKERGQEASGDIKLTLDVRHAPRDWSNAEILSVMSDVIDEHPRPKLEFVLGVLGLSKVPDSLDERLRSQGAKAYAIGVRTRALRRKKEAKEKEERERREKKEKERREKKEREEREKRAKEEKERIEKERVEKERIEKERIEKERIEKERIEKERIQRERAEEEKRKAAQRKEAEAKRARGKPRKGRRGRPTTRAVATERAKQIEMDQEPSGEKMLLECSEDELQNADAKEVETLSSKQSASVGEEKSEKMEVSTIPAPTVSPPSLRGVKASKEEQPPPTDASKAESKPGPSAKRKAGPAAAGEAIEVEQPVEALEQAKASDTKHEAEQTIVDTGGAQEADESASKPPSAVGEEPQASEEQKGHIAASEEAPPKMIAEAIASALKESAAAVNGEISHPSISTKDVADVGEGSAAVEYQAPREEEVPISAKVAEDKGVVEPEKKSAAATEDVTMMPEDVKVKPETTKEPVQLKPAPTAQKETLIDAKAVDEGVIERPAGKSVEKETGAEASPMDIKEEKAVEVVKEEEEKEAQDGSKEVSETAEEKDEEHKPEEATGAEGVEKAKEPEQVAEDFMADVFGPEDENGEKEETEEAVVAKRGRRYRFRGRQTDEDEEDTKVVTIGKGAKVEESEEEAQSKEKRKRARPKQGTRRTSRRVSSIHNEMVVVPAGRRMRRESRNLIDGAWQLPNADQYLLECVDVWERLHGNRITIPFREPVAAKDAPGYFDIVKNPMDMRTVKEMLQDGKISSPDEFYKQMKLICSNAILFNDEDSDLYELAVELRGMIRKETKPIMKAWRESRGVDVEESESESEVESQQRRGRARSKKKSSKAKSKGKKGATEKRKRGREDDGAGRNKKRRILRRSSRREEE